MLNNRIEHSALGKSIAEELSALKVSCGVTWDEMLPLLDTTVSVTKHPAAGFSVFLRDNKRILIGLAIGMVILGIIYFIAESGSSEGPSISPVVTDTIKPQVENPATTPVPVDTPKVKAADTVKVQGAAVAPSGSVSPANKVPVIAPAIVTPAKAPTNISPVKAPANIAPVKTPVVTTPPKVEQGEIIPIDTNNVDNK